MGIKASLKQALAAFIPHKTITYRGLSIQGAFEDYGLLQALARDAREPYMTRLFLEEMRPGAIVVDVGAHVGHYTVLAADVLRRLGGGRVIAFEANQRCFKYLERNVGANGLAELVERRHAAVSDKAGMVELFADRLQSDYSSLVSKRDTTAVAVEKIQAVSLDEHFAGKAPPTIVKIDIEGAEMMALRGMSRMLASPTRPRLFVESNAEALAQGGATPEGLVDLIRGYGYDVQVIDEERAALVPFQPGVHGVGCHNLFFRPTPS